MKTKNYRFGTTSCKTYMKSVGHGWECGFIFGGKPIFVGNFIHRPEASQWWTKMNAELNKFTKKFWVAKPVPKAWYGKFIGNHLYKNYYRFVNTALSKHNRKFTTALNKDQRKYRRMKPKFKPSNRIPLKRAA